MNWAKFKKEYFRGFYSYWTFCANWLIGLRGLSRSGQDSVRGADKGAVGATAVPGACKWTGRDGLCFSLGKYSGPQVLIRR